MDFKGIAELIKAVSDSKMTSLELKEKDLYIKMKKEDDNITLKSSIPDAVYKKDLKEDNQDAKESIKDENIHIVKSPIVGNFYSAEDPDKKPYVNVGSKVKKGETLCIIEAMKLMNEITSDVDGQIVKIYPKNGDMVEYGQELFQIMVDK